MTKADEIRKYYRDNPSASVKEVVEATGVTDKKVRAYVSKDVKAGRCIRTKKVLIIAVSFTKKRNIAIYLNGKMRFEEN